MRDEGARRGAGTAEVQVGRDSRRSGSGFGGEAPVRRGGRAVSGRRTGPWRAVLGSGGYGEGGPQTPGEGLNGLHWGREGDGPPQNLGGTEN